jgi:hypothetical protein
MVCPLSFCPLSFSLIVYGSKTFVQDTFVAYRDQFGLKRRTGPRKLRNAAVPELFTMRDLRLTPITPSG